MSEPVQYLWSHSQLILFLAANLSSATWETNVTCKPAVAWLARDHYFAARPQSVSGSRPTAWADIQEGSLA